MRARLCYPILILCLVTFQAVWADVESPAPLSSVDSAMRETELGDLVADAVRSAAQTPVALVPAGAFRELTIAKTTVSADDIASCLQYPDDRIAIIELTGSELISALERSVSVSPRRNLGFLQVSGLAVVVDVAAGKGSRVRSVKVGDRQVEPSARYRIATTEPLAKGGYGYFTVWGKDRLKDLKDTSVLGSIKSFVNNRKSVDYREKNRIVNR